MIRRCMFGMLGACVTLVSAQAFAQYTEEEPEYVPVPVPETETEYVPVPEPAPEPAPEYRVEQETTYTTIESEPPMYTEEDESDLMTEFGIGVSAGGGVTGFVEDVPRNTADVGGAWTARLTLGTRSFIAGELAYVGSAQDIDALGLDPDSRLVGNGAEGAARVNFTRGIVQPYVLAGVGWTHYSLVNSDFNTSSVEDSDNVVQFPLGAGLAFQYDQLLLDLRGVFRPTVSDDLFAQDNMHTWGANLQGGFAF